MELLIDTTTAYEILAYIDGYSEYKKIKMHLHEEEMIAFLSPKKVFC